MNADLYDLYDLGPNNNDAGEGQGSLGERLELDQARFLARNRRQQQHRATMVVSIDYWTAGLPITEARVLAIEALEQRKRDQPLVEFGELDEGSDEGGWWYFMADNLTAQDAGASPAFSWFESTSEWGER